MGACSTPLVRRIGAMRHKGLNGARLGAELVGARAAREQRTLVETQAGHCVHLGDLRSPPRAGPGNGRSRPGRTARVVNAGSHPVATVTPSWAAHHLRFEVQPRAPCPSGCPRDGGTSTICGPPPCAPRIDP